jgi:phage tail P2-like protein
MSKYSLNADNFLRTLPEVLQNDPSIQALASAIASELETLAQKVQLAEIYTHIDDLDETMLDALAADFKVDWWRPDASISEKRAALKASWYIHKHLGTKSAIETAVADYLGDGKVEEWFEYGGKPYHFRVSSKNNANIVAQYDSFMAVLDVVKRCSAVLDHISAQLAHSQKFYVGMAMKVAKTGAITCEPVDVSDVTLLTDENGVPLLDESGIMLTT